MDDKKKKLNINSSPKRQFNSEHKKKTRNYLKDYDLDYDFEPDNFTHGLSYFDDDDPDCKHLYTIQMDIDF